MLLNKQRLLSLAAVCGTLAFAGIGSVQAGEPSAPGVVRISDRASGVRQTSHSQYPLGTAVRPVGRFTETLGGNCDSGNCGSGNCGNGCGKGGCLKRIWDADIRYKKCKYGYFLPSGCGGGGCPWFGTYDLVYPVNPQHFDARDGRIYAAQGYGTPMAVPLAPNVRHTFNYGWGIPSSRRTAISNPAPRIQYLNP